MFKSLAGTAIRSKSIFASGGNTVRKLSVTNNEWVVFPRETEGNIYSVNYSLNEDGVTSVGDAFRNARLPILLNRLEVKLNNNVAELNKPAYFGDCEVTEAGDNISHEAFSEKFSAQTDHLSSGISLFVEDASLGAHTFTRLGVRVTTDNAGTALIFRKLSIATPPREVDHRSKFKGWNLDPRWEAPQSVWTGDCFEITETQTVPLPAQRSVVALVGGPGDTVSVQFVEKDKKLVGANVVAGNNVPVRSLVAALGHASSVLINEEHEAALAIPSLTLTKGKDTTVVVGADDAVVEWAVSGSSLHGAYHNVLTAEGVSALWNGVIGSADESRFADDVPTVKVGKHAAHAISPDNLVHPATHFIFYESGAAQSSITKEEAVKRLVALSHDSKEALAAALVNNARLSIVGQVDALAALSK